METWQFDKKRKWQKKTMSHIVEPSILYVLSVRRQASGLRKRYVGTTMSVQDIRLFMCHMKKYPSSLGVETVCNDPPPTLSENINPMSWNVSSDLFLLTVHWTETPIERWGHRISPTGKVREEMEGWQWSDTRFRGSDRFPQGPNTYTPSLETITTGFKGVNIKGECVEDKRRVWKVNGT